MDRPDLKSGEIYYPETDGRPVAETDRHRDLMFEILAAARYRFRDAEDVYVSGNLLVYFVEGDPTRSVAPDVFVVRGVSNRQRRVYKIWEEGKGPDVIIELTSTRTHREDLGDKRAIYEMIGVLEYFLFDPDGVRFQPQLRGFRLEGGVLQPVSAARGPDGTLVLPSSVLGLELRAAGSSLRWVDPVSGAKIPIPADFIQAAETAEDRARQAAREIAELREEIDRLRGGSAR